MTETKMIEKVDTAAIAIEYFSDNNIEGFIASRHSSDNTAKTYRNGIRQMLKFFAANNITAPTTTDIDNFINTLRADKKAKATLALYFRIIKLFFNYLEKQGVYRDVAAQMVPLRLKKDRTHKKSSLTNAQAQKLLASVTGSDVIALRDKACLVLALSCGLRCCEISRANVGDFKDCGEYWTLDVIGKGSDSEKDAEQVKVALPVAEMINHYLNVRGSHADDEPLFTSTSNNRTWQKNSYGSRLSEQSISKLIAKYMKRAGVKSSKVTAHSTRHYAAVQAIRNGVDLREVSAMLRHTSLNTTLIYLDDIKLESRRAELSVASSLLGGAA